MHFFEKSEANTPFSAKMWLTPPPLAHSGSATVGGNSCENQHILSSGHDGHGPLWGWGTMDMCTGMLDSGGSSIGRIRHTPPLLLVRILNFHAFF